MPRKLVRRYKGRKKKHRSEERSSPRHNPPLLTDVAEYIGPGFAGFAAARFATHIAVTQIAKRKPAWSKHAGAGAAIAAFLAAWLLAHRWKWLARWQTPIMVGSGIAAIQSLLQLYIPKLGWMVSDATPEIAAASAASTQLPQDAQITNDDPNLYVMDDRYDAGRMSAAQAPPATQGAQAGQAVDDDLSDLDIEDAVGQTQSMGVFGAGN